MSNPAPYQVVLQILGGSWKSQCLSVAARLGIADLVKDGPKNSEELAKATGTHAPSLYRVLRALASVGVFVEDADGKFGLTPPAACLQSDVPGSQRSLAIMMGEEHFRSWADLLYSVQTGQPAFDRIFGKPIFPYLAEHPEAAAIFDDAMTGVHGTETAAMLDAYDFSPFRTVMDVGGGNGTMLATVLNRHPKLQGILFDRADVIDRAQTNLRKLGVADRCQTIAGDFFKSIPAGGDAYLMRHIIHDWNDDQSQTILRHCRRAMNQNGKLLLVESVIPPGNDPFFGKLLDVNMLVIPGGMERTEAQYRELYRSAGFQLTRIVPTKAEISVIEGKPV